MTARIEQHEVTLHYSRPTSQKSHTYVLKREGQPSELWRVPDDIYQSLGRPKTVRLIVRRADKREV
jgi:hypothetical protein